jgi:Glycosyl transferase 4-like domain
MKLLFLASAGGAAMRRSLHSAITLAAMKYELRMLAPDAEGKLLRDCGVPTESWRPAGLFNVLRAINVLRRAVERFEPDAIHAFGWTAGAVALGALPSRYARRTLVTLQDPVRKTSCPRRSSRSGFPSCSRAASWASRRPPRADRRVCRPAGVGSGLGDRHRRGRKRRETAAAG